VKTAAFRTSLDDPMYAAPSIKKPCDRCQSITDTGWTFRGLGLPVVQEAVLSCSRSFDGLLLPVDNATSAPEPDSADFIRRAGAPRAKSDIKIDYLQKILYVIFTSPMTVKA